MLYKKFFTLQLTTAVTLLNYLKLCISVCEVLGKEKLCKVYVLLLSYFLFLINTYSLFLSSFLNIKNRILIIAYFEFLIESFNPFLNF